MNLPITDRKMIAALVAMFCIVFTLLLAYGSYKAGIRTYKQQHMRYCTIYLADGRQYIARTRLDRNGLVWVDDILMERPWNHWVPIEVAAEQDSTLNHWNAGHFRPYVKPLRIDHHDLKPVSHD